MNKLFSIAIDGPAGAGKSTVAKGVAELLGARYLDTGAMYRTMALFMKRNGFVTDDAIAREAKNADVRVSFIDDRQHMFLGEEDVTSLLRTPEASAYASNVAKSAPVREKLVALQRAFAEKESIVMDGRDIGTVVLPEATVKIFLTASAEERARRRCAELGGSQDYNDVLRDIIKRDYNDAHRDVSPMKPACDAVRIDCSAMTAQQVIDEIVRIAKEKE